MLFGQNVYKVLKNYGNSNTGFFLRKMLGTRHGPVGTRFL